MERTHFSGQRPTARLALIASALGIAVAACGDDSSGGEVGDGCSTDVECKGDRICVDR